MGGGGGGGRGGGGGEHRRENGWVKKIFDEEKVGSEKIRPGKGVGRQKITVPQNHFIL
jgi:hypothetical protein